MIEPGRQGCFELGQGRLDAIDRVDDVRARLARNDHQDGSFPVHQPARAYILHRVLHVGDVRQLR